MLSSFWLSERRRDARLATAAALIETALASVIAVPGWRTANMGGPAGTRAFTRHMLDAIG